MKTRSALVSLAASALLVPISAAQWSSDPAQNLAVADAASDQNLAKLAATADGGTWVSWFDGIGSGWDVRVQRLEADGSERFAHNGLLVVRILPSGIWKILSKWSVVSCDTDSTAAALRRYSGMNVRM
jgi:hypothetical protein